MYLKPKTRICNPTGRWPKNVFVDASHTSSSGLTGGVHRVVRNICHFTPKLVRSKCSIVVVRNHRFTCEDPKRVTLAKLSTNVAALQANILAYMPRLYVTVAKAVCEVIRSRKLRQWLLPLPGHQGILKFPLKTLERLLRAARRETSLGAEDLLILPDAYWAHEQVWPAVRNARDNGVFVISVVYDLIPLTHPSFVAVGAPDSFKRYLHEVAHNSDMIVAISDTVRDEITATLPRLWPDENICQDVRSFPLGAEFQKVVGTVRGEVKEVFHEDCIDNPYLMVATFDPRKNHEYLLDAFEEIWKSDPSRTLCFVGRVGWCCDDILERIQGHPKRGTHLFIFHDLSDAELSYCYQRASAICFPSITEGFRLPIVEALLHGRYVFAADTSIHREVGKDECIYCNLDSPLDLANKIIFWERDKSSVSPTRNSEQKMVDCESSIKRLLEHCLRGFASDDTKKVV